MNDIFNFIRHRNEHGSQASVERDKNKYEYYILVKTSNRTLYIHEYNGL